LSAGAATVGRLPLPVSGREKPARAADGSTSAAVDISLFAAIAFVGLAQWSRLVAHSPMVKLLFALGVTCLGARLLVGVRAGSDRGLARTLLAYGIAIVTFCAALVVAGLPARLLLPAHWGELFANVGDGLRGIEDAAVPYDGGNAWVSLDFILGGTAMTAIAAAIAFWPAARRDHRRVVALVLLLASYAVPIALYQPGAELFWGLLLLILSAAWLWISRLHGARRNIALAVAFGAGVLALPIAARAGDEPLLDYRTWNLFGASASVSFNWDHTYGPLQWPNDGATMFSVKTARPLYWKASVLDRFNGVAWQRAQAHDPAAVAERSARRDAPGGGLNQLHPGWVQEAEFQIDGLQTSLVIGAGTPLSVTDNVQPINSSPDGTLFHPGGALDGSTDYKIVTYDPNPTVDQLQTAPPRYPASRFAPLTLLGIPPSGAADPETLAMPLWGTRSPAIEQRVMASPYADVYRLARAWTAQATTPYEAVTAIQSQLRRGYTYTPNVPNHVYPLESFLFEDKAGYCQQFAGAMALMLRMVGVPTRVVSGFAPGSPNSDDGSYVVHDFDAHSWVEVYFRGIGWVTFDPTPAAAPAESQAGQIGSPERRGAALLAEGASGITGGGHNSGLPGTTGAGAASESSGVPAAVIVLALLIFGGIGALVVYRLRGRIHGSRSDVLVAELRNALDRAGWHLAPGTTLLDLERRVAAAGREPVARYAAMLRDHRYAGDRSPLPSEEQRRAMRRSLIAGGPLRRWRAWLLVPPGGPRPQR
jgi:hypothetical protein